MKMQSRRDGDYNFHVLMTLTADSKCDDVTSVGLLRVFGVKFAVERINADKNFLPNISIGYEMNDGCLSVPITMSRGIDIARKYRDSFCKNRDDTCYLTEQNKGQNVAVIGAYYSYASLPLASLLSLHNIPQISYGSSSPLLSKNKLYKSFYRTIPSDKNQIDVFIEILKHMNWTYVFVVGSDDDYGKLAVTGLKKEVSSNDICFAGEMYIPHDTAETRAIAKQIVRKIKKDEKAQVVLMFGYAQGMADHILTEAESNGLQRYWLTSEGWNPHILKVNAPPNQLLSVLTISLVKGTLPEFSTYLRDVVTRDHNCDIWMKTFIAQQFNCNTSIIKGEYFIGTKHNQTSENCSLRISTVTDYILRQNPNQINNLVDAVYALAHGLDAVVKEKCSDVTVTERCVPRIEVEELTKAMHKVSFESLQKKRIDFDKYGDIKAVSYSIENLKRVNGAFQYQPVGDWLKTRKQKLHLNPNEVTWPRWFNLHSRCSRTCQPGEYVVGKRGCCWECRACPENTASNVPNANSCIQCSHGYHTKNNINCEMTQITYLSYESNVGIVIVTISVVGVISTLLVCCGFCLQKKTDAIKKPGKLLQSIAFVIILATFLFAPFLVLQPSKTLCTAKEIYFAFLINAYCSLLYVQNKSVVNFFTKCTSDKMENKQIGQVTMFILLILIQVFFITAWKSTTELTVEHHKTRVDEILEQCPSNFPVLKIVIIVYPCIVLTMATIAAFPDRHQPHKYSEPKYINYTCVASCILTVAYLFSMKHVKGKFHAMALSFTLSGYGFVYLMCLLTPKLYWALTRQDGRIKDSVKSDNGVANEAYIAEEENNVKDEPIQHLTRL